MLRTVKSLATLPIVALPLWLVCGAIFRDDPATLTVRLSEPGVTVWVGDREYATPTNRVGPILVTPGEQTVRVTRQGRELFARDITFEPGETQDLVAQWDESSPALGGSSDTPDLGAERTRVGLPATVNTVAFSAGGRFGLSADCEGLLRVWDINRGEEKVVEAHTTGVDLVAAFNDGKGLVTVGRDRILRVWDVAGGKLLREIQVQSGLHVSALVVSPDGTFAVTGDEHAVVRGISLTTGREEFHVESPRNSVGALAFTPDGKRILVGLLGNETGGHVVQVRDTADGRLVRQLDGHKGSVWGVACTPDGRRAVTASSDRTIRVWDLVSGRELSRMGEHPGVARCLALSDDGRFVAVGTGHRWAGCWRPAESYGVQLWDLESGRSLGRFLTDSAICSVAISPDGRRATAADTDHVLRSWEIPASALLSAPASLSARASSRGAVPGGEFIGPPAPGRKSASLGST